MIAHGDLLERAAELEAIDAVLESARAGSGRCLALMGDAGLGKSRLMAHAAQAAHKESMTVLRARGADLERDFTFGVALQLFEPVLVDAGADRDALMAGPAALCEPLFAGTEGVRDPTPSESEFPLLHGLHWLAANASERCPLVLLIDDAHWADLASLGFALYLLQRLDELPIAVLVSARPSEPGGQSKHVRRILRHDLTAVQTLAPLSTDGVARIVQEELAADADAELCGACAAATGGNPFYLRELIAAMRAQGRPSGDGAVLGTEPASATIKARIAALPEAAHALAAAVAVLGDGAPLAQAAALAELEPDDAAVAADELADEAVLERGAVLSFVHPILRQVVYANVSEARRAQSHARAAELLEAGGADAELVANHLVQAHGVTDAGAVPALRHAAVVARKRGAAAAAARYLREAIAIAVRPEDRGAVLTELALAEAKARESGAAERANEALDAIEDPRERAAAALEIGLVMVDTFQPEATAVFDRGIEALGDDAGADDDLALTLRAARAAIGFGHATASPRDLDAIFDRAARGVASPVERLMLAHGALGHALRGEAADDLRRLTRTALEGFEPDVTSPTDMAAFSLSVTGLFMSGALDEAERVVTPALDSARERGLVLAFGTLSHIRAHLLYRLGRLEDAIADAQSALDVERYGWEPELPGIHAVLALCLIERGELDAAAAALEVPGGEERWSSTFTWADLLDARGRIHLARGDAQAALDDLLACGERLKPINASHSGVVPWRPGAVLAAARLGDVEMAGELAAEDVELARAFGAARELGLALRTAGVVAGGDRGIALLREAVDVLRESEAPLELAHALADLGGVLLDDGHRLAAREALAEALDLAHGCGADALEETARERLVATGARPRRASVRGRDALTPRERRLALMAADGMGNREIAAALFITTKTVETHLGRVYRKLGVSGRAELAGPLAEE